MTRAELVRELKDVLKESSVDAAWGDTRLTEFLAEAQDQFCEDTGYFVDKRTYTITTVAGTAAYALSDRIIEVKSVWDGTRKLGKFKEQNKDPYGRIGVPVEFPSDAGSEPYAWQTDDETGYITLYPTPTTSDDVYILRVWRRSLKWLSDADVEPEIPRQCHRGLIHYAAYIALTDHDMEVEDEVTAKDHFDNYTWYMHKGVTMRNRITAARTDAEPNATYI